MFSGKSTHLFLPVIFLLLFLHTAAYSQVMGDNRGFGFVGFNDLARYYEFSWGTWPNIESLSINYLGITGLLNDSIGYAIKGSPIDNIPVRLINFFVVQGGVGCYFIGTLEHEFGHLGYAFEAGFKPHLASFNVETIRPEYFAKTSEDKIVMYLGGGMNTDSYTSYNVTTALYSGKHVPCNYSLIALFKKISNFQYVYSRAGYVKHPLGNIKEFYKNYDPLLYATYLTMKYGYYDSVIPVWGYAPYFKKSLFVPANPYAYINPFLKDQYRRLKTAYLIELLDPSFLQIFWALRCYMKWGTTMFMPLMVPVGSVKFMPGMRASLGTFGVENYYDVYFAVWDLFQFSVYYRNGGNMFDTMHGAGIDVRGICITEQLSADIRADYWTLVEGKIVQKNRDYLLYNNLQPMTGLGFFRKHYNDRNCFNVTVKIRWQFYEDWYVTGTVGYKSYGALIGKQLDRGVYGDGGIGFNLHYTK